MSLSSDILFSILSTLSNFPLYRVNRATAISTTHIPEVVFLNTTCVKEMFLNKLHFKNLVPFKNIGVKLKENSKKFNDETAAYFKEIHTLDMRNCNQKTITDHAFSNLRGIHTLDMRNCNQETITDQAFSYLQGIHTLDMRNCNQETITDQAFSYLQGIHTLDMRGCNQKTITDQVISILSGSTIIR
jgi:O-acetylhomoserine/O-acetylserine sulfhydrylase-like pyridoxal-dependent enzyme